MSSEALARVIAQASTDGAFRRELVGDPQGVGAANGLSIEEVDALMSGDSARLRQVGVSEQLSHFTLMNLPLVDRAIVDKLPAVQRGTNVTTKTNPPHNPKPTGT
jgi:hypothetical protein